MKLLPIEGVDLVLGVLKNSIFRITYTRLNKKQATEILPAS